MRTRYSLVLVSLAAPLILMQLDFSGCLTGLGGTQGQTGTSGRFNAPPVVALTADIVRGIAPLTANFSSAGSTDDSLIVSRLWDFGDGQTSRDISPSHTFQTTGTFTVRLTLTDDDGAQTTRSTVIYVTQAPIAVIHVDREVAESAPALFNFDGSGSYDPDGTIALYQWDFGDGSRELLPVVVHTFATSGTYRVRLTVTDNTGVTGLADKFIEVGIPQPSITFRLPPSTASNVVVSPRSPLWAEIVYNVEPGVPRTIRAGIDGDRDSCEAQAVLYNGVSDEVPLRFSGHTDRVRAAAFSPDGNLVLTGSDDTTLRLYSAKTGELIRNPDSGNAGEITSLAFAPDGATYVYAGVTGRVVLRNTATGSEIREFTGHPLAVRGVAFSADGSRVVSAGDGAIAIVHDAATGTVVRVLDGILPDGTHTGHDYTITAVAFAPTNRDVVLTGSVDQTAKLWRVPDGTVLRTYSGGHTNAITSVAFSPDSQFVLTGSDDATAKLWSTLGATAPLRTFAGHRDRVTCVNFSPDGLQVVTGSVDGTVIVWDVNTGAAVHAPLAPCDSPISSVAFSKTGGKILVGVAARNDIQLDILDTNLANGNDNPDSTAPPRNDLNLTMPTALNLSVLTDVLANVQYAEYYLWAELSTDRSAARRVYANPVITVVRRFTPTIELATPRLPAGTKEAYVVLEATPTRQILNLGPLRKGDRLYLSLLSTPGYGEFLQTNERFSVMVLDGQQEVFAWYQESYVLFTPDAKLIIGHDSPNYYVVVDGVPPTLFSSPVYGQSVAVRVEPDVGLVPRQQRIYLDFAGGKTVAIPDYVPFAPPPFHAEDLNSNWGAAETATIKAGIVQYMRDRYARFNVVISTSDDGHEPVKPFQTVYFGGRSDEFYGISQYIDPRNETLTGAALVTTLDIAFDFPQVTPEEMGDLIGSVATHESAHLLGLRHTEGGFNDIMDPNAPIGSPTAIFVSSPLYRAEEYNGQIGTQNAPILLEEVVGLKPQP